MTSLLLVAAVTTAARAAGEKGKVEGEDLRQQAINYEHGRGVEQDYQKAFLLYCMAVNQGNSAAAYHLGWMYVNQRGVESDRGRAVWWFSKAAAGGDREARGMLELLAEVEAKKDHSCNALNQEDPDREQIEAWVTRWAPAYGLEPDLVLAVIAAESGFNTQARSHKNARGLMQLIPATAKRFGVKKLSDPEQNLRGGMAYLQWLIKRFKGNVKLVLAAYNAGEGAVDNYQGVPPYAETHNYIKRISRYYSKSVHPVIDNLLSMNH